jgi:hypothetical protein
MGLPPDFLSSLLALANFMRLSLKKAARANMDGTAYRKSGSPRLFRPRYAEANVGHPSCSSSSNLVEIHLVDAAPSPILSWFDGSYDRVPDFVEVRRGMAISGGIATANLAAFHAHAQVDPGSSDLETFLATPGLRRHLLHMIFYVRALCSAHGILFFYSGVLTTGSSMKLAWPGA